MCEEDSEDVVDGVDMLAPSHLKSKLEEAITAKQELEAKVAMLEEKVKRYEEENAELKQLVIAIYETKLKMHLF